MYFVKSNLKFEDYKHCLEATQLENKINHLLKNKLTADDLWENLKEFIKKHELILKAQQRFKSEEHKAFTEEFNKIPLSANMIKE